MSIRKFQQRMTKAGHHSGVRSWAVRAGTVLVLMLGLPGIASAAEPATSAPPPTPPQLEQAIRRGVDFLVASQNKDGSWGSPRNTKDLNIYAPVPGAHDAFRCGTSALCVEALIETGLAEKDPAIKQALARGKTWLLENLSQLRRADGTALYNVWGHAYGIQALVAILNRTPKNSPRREQIRTNILGQIELLRRYESVDGGWAYYDFRVGAQRPASDSLSFVSATVLVAFHKAELAGIEIPKDLRQRALDSIQRQRKKDNSYLYGEYLKYSPMMPVNRPAGSLGRSQACNVALRYWGDRTITDAVLTDWLDRLVARNEWLSVGRKKPIPHESWFQIAGYFYYYGHYYAALCVEELDVKLAPAYQDHLAALLLPLQEKDGSWWDYPLYDYHQPYGTGFALMTLARCRKPAGK